MARVALALNDPALAVLASGGMLEAAVEPDLIRLTCRQALAGAQDPRAGWMLDLAHRAVQATAAAVTDQELRDSFLAKHPANRVIVAAWQARS